MAHVIWAILKPRTAPSAADFRSFGHFQAAVYAAAASTLPHPK